MGEKKMIKDIPRATRSNTKLQKSPMHFVARALARFIDLGISAAFWTNLLRRRWTPPWDSPRYFPRLGKNGWGIKSDRYQIIGNKNLSTGDDSRVKPQFVNYLLTGYQFIVQQNPQKPQNPCLGESYQGEVVA